MKNAHSEDSMTVLQQEWSLDSAFNRSRKQELKHDPRTHRISSQNNQPAKLMMITLATFTTTFTSVINVLSVDRTLGTKMTLLSVVSRGHLSGAHAEAEWKCWANNVGKYAAKVWLEGTIYHRLLAWKTLCNVVKDKIAPHGLQRLFLVCFLTHFWEHSGPARRQGHLEGQTNH